MKDALKSLDGHNHVIPSLLQEQMSPALSASGLSPAFLLLTWPSIGRHPGKLPQDKRDVHA